MNEPPPNAGSHSAEFRAVSGPGGRQEPTTNSPARDIIHDTDNVGQVATTQAS